MAGIIRIMMLCALLSGCAATGGLSSLTTIGGGASEPEKPAASSSSQATPKSAESSGVGGIWDNFSSVFSSGEQPAPQTEVKTASEKPSFDPNEAVRLINEYRSKKGLHPLTLDAQVSAAAAALSSDMAKHDHMSHYGPNGADVGKRLVAAGYPYRVAAENVGVGQQSLSAMIDSWKKSPPHSRNMLLADAKNMGIALEYRPDTKFKTYWTLVVAAQ